MPYKSAVPGRGRWEGKASQHPMTATFAEVLFNVSAYVLADVYARQP